MKNHSNLFGAYGIIFSLILSMTAPLLLPHSVSAQETKADQTAQQNAKKKRNQSKKTNSDHSALPTDSPSGNAQSRPLSTDEDPSQIGKRNINKGFVGWLGGSKEKEIAIGRQIAAEVEQQSKILDDPIVTEYVNRVGQNIALHSDVKVPVTIKVIDSDEVNAFALPGGFMFVNKGLILAADKEDELAGVMAHELGHVAARHAMENNGKSQLLNHGMLAGLILGGPGRFSLFSPKSLAAVWYFFINSPHLSVLSESFLSRRDCISMPLFCSRLISEIYRKTCFGICGAFAEEFNFVCGGNDITAGVVLTAGITEFDVISMFAFVLPVR